SESERDWEYSAPQLAQHRPKLQRRMDAAEAFRGIADDGRKAPALFLEEAIGQIAGRRRNAVIAFAADHDQCVRISQPAGLHSALAILMVRRCRNGASDMNEFTLTAVDPTADDVQYLEDRIYQFNSSTTGIGDGESLAFFVRARDRIVAGICGNTWGGTCELRQFWVDEPQRHRGLGTKLLRAAELEARRRGCTQI